MIIWVDRDEKIVDELLRHPVPYINESIRYYVLRLCFESSCRVNQITDLIDLSEKSLRIITENLKMKVLLNLLS